MQPDPRKNGKTLKAGVVLCLFVAWQGSPAAAQSPGTFTTSGNMTTARSWHTATLLHNGKVLIAGGERAANFSNPASPLASPKLYNQKTGAFTPTSEMTVSRRSHTATLLADGRVLMAGGYGTFGSLLDSTELYDPS